jgi:hypothetical protein
METKAKHLVIRNPNFENRIGCWNTVMLTACGLTLPPVPVSLYGTELDVKRNVTLRVDMATCIGCLLWADRNPTLLFTGESGHLVSASFKEG